MAEVFMELKGLKEITDRLKQIPIDLEKNAIQSATRAVAKEAAEELKQRTPVKTGKARESWRVGTKMDRERGGRVAYLMARWYLRLIERGFMHRRSGKHIGPRPFIRPIFDSLTREYPQKIADAVMKRLKRYERKAAKMAQK